MNKMKAGLVAAAMLASFSGAALAEGSFYGALDVGQSKYPGACDDMPAGVSCSETDTMFRGSIGYPINPNLAVEASYADYGASEASGFGATASVAASGFQFSAVGSLPISDVFSLTGKLGVALTKGELSGTGFVTEDDSSTTVAYGVGVRYNISKTVAVRAQYESLGEISASSTDPTAKGDVDFLTAGVIFSF